MQTYTKVNDVLNELSNSGFTHPVSVHPGVGEILYSLTRNLGPTIIVEIGSFIGYSSICFAQAMEDNNQKEGIVYGIDLFQPHPKNPLFLKQDIDNPLQLAGENSKKAGLGHRIVFMKGSSHELAKDLLSKIDLIDILFIDGDHTYNGVLRDYNLYHAKVRKNGLIIFHDIYPARCGWWGPRVLIDTLKRGIWRHYDILEIDTPDGFGLAVCKKLFDGASEISSNKLTEFLRKAYAYYRQGGTWRKLYQVYKSGKSVKDSYSKI
ncbi:MAG TPA: class I SAM-dependent methyltransferase [Thermodesulfobacteriota bacterium]|nr:class I SAM-dependent methyltransferase [Thermodesulfobacteriota bacterium]